MSTLGRLESIDKARARTLGLPLGWVERGRGVDNGVGILVLLVLALLYFAPALVAERRKHRQVAAITVLNLFLGWTVIGWVVALVWAFVVSERVSAPVTHDAGAPTPTMPVPAVAPAVAVLGDEGEWDVNVARDRRNVLAAGGVGVLILVAIVAFTSSRSSPDVATAEAVPSYLRSESRLLSVCAVASARAARSYVGAEGLSPVIGETPQVASGKLGAVVTCQVKTSRASGWLNAIVACEDVFKTNCLTPSTLSLAGSIAAMR